MPREPEGLQWHGGALREGGPAGDIAAAWSPSSGGIVTLVCAGRSDEELHRMLEHVLECRRAGAAEAGAEGCGG